MVAVLVVCMMYVGMYASHALSVKKYCDNTFFVLLCFRFVSCRSGAHNRQGVKSLDSPKFFH